VPYSTQLLAGQPAAGAPISYVVPSGYVGVLRELDVLNLYDGDTVFVAYLTVPGPVTLQFVNQDIPTFGATYQWRGRLVMNAGDSLELGTTETYCDAIASGYLLSAP
jgi:hypothetical protein